MSYTKLLKKWESESKKKDKQERIARIKEKELKLKRADELFIALRKEEKLQQELQEKKNNEMIGIKDNIILQLRKNNPFTYAQYLIVWDVLTGNYMQIETDINRGKINRLDITKAIEYIEDFSSEIIGEYWNNRLLEMTA